MGKKTMSADQRVMEFLSEDLWFELRVKDVRVRKMMLKGGLGDWLLVITAVKDNENVVAFVGSTTITGVARKVHQQFLADEMEWQVDKYAD